jgi:hypothetical protein
MQYRYVLSTIFSLAFVTAAAAQSLPRVAKGTSYPQARKNLTGMGYKPVRLPGADTCDKSDPRCFPEANACAGTGLAQCVYTWQRGKMLIEVLTVGEMPVVERVRCRANCR